MGWFSNWFGGTRSIPNGSQPQQPVIHPGPPAGCDHKGFVSHVTVSIVSPDGSPIVYTLDGSDPDLQAPSDVTRNYTGPFTLTANTRVKAMAVAGGAASAIASVTYLVAPAH